MKAGLGRYRPQALGSTSSTTGHQGFKKTKKSTQFINLVLLTADVLAADAPGAGGPRSNIAFGFINATLFRTDVTILL